MLAEGFDDDGEDGTGEKLLTVIQKMDMGNIMVIVCIWNSGVTIGDSRLRGGEFYRMITDRARDLLKSIKDEVNQGNQAMIEASSPNFKATKTAGTLNFSTKKALDKMGHGDKTIDQNDE